MRLIGLRGGSRARLDQGDWGGVCGHYIILCRAERVGSQTITRTTAQYGVARQGLQFQTKQPPQAGRLRRYYRFLHHAAYPSDEQYCAGVGLAGFFCLKTAWLHSGVPRRVSTTLAPSPRSFSALPLLTPVNESGEHRFKGICAESDRSLQSRTSTVPLQGARVIDCAWNADAIKTTLSLPSFPSSIVPLNPLPLPIAKFNLTPPLLTEYGVRQ
jgi:hypothetical protein